MSALRLHEVDLPRCAMLRPDGDALSAQHDAASLWLMIDTLPTAPVAERLRAMPHLTALKVTLAGADPDALVRAVAAWPALTALEVNGMGCATTETLAPLSAAASLRALRLDQFHRLEASLATMLPTLTTLEVSRSQEDDGSLSSALSSMTSLEGLTLHGIEGMKAALPALLRLPKLEALSLRWRYFTPDAFDGETTLGHLRSLHVSGCPLPPPTAFDNAAQLDELGIDAWRLDKAVLSAWLSLDGLRRLQIDGVTLGPWLEALLQRAALTSFRATSAKVNGAGLKTLAKLPALRELRLDGSLGMSDVFANVARCRHLEVLDLRGAPIDDAALSAIARLPRLRELYLAGCTRLSTDALTALRAARPDLVLDIERDRQC